jgi:hypothetical protein
MTALWFVLGAAFAQEDHAWAQLDEAHAWEPVTIRETDVGPVSISVQRVGAHDCVQGSLRTEVPLRWLEAVVNDTSGDESWRTTEVAVSKMLLLTRDRMEFYQVMDVPDWTMSADRWWLLRAWSEPPGATTRRFRWHHLDALASYPEVHAAVQERFPGAIELPVNWGEWVFHDQGEERETTYRVCTDLGGSLPKWIQRLAIRQTLPDNLVDLVREARRREEAG